LVPGAIVISFGPYANFAILISTVAAGEAVAAKITGTATIVHKNSARAAQARSALVVLREEAKITHGASWRGPDRIKTLCA
jgi:hypothetical protein